MPSLSQLLTNHSGLLVLDAASTRVQTGLLRCGKPAIWHAASGEAGAEIFHGTEAVLREAGASLEEVGAFLFCEGPGSMLGIRSVAMALRTWQVLQPRPIYAYQSLAVAGRFAWSRAAGREFTVIADARRDTWHCQRVHADGELPPLQRVPSAELAGGEYVTPESFRAWAEPPTPALPCNYDLSAIFASLENEDLFRQTDLPDAFSHAAPEYKKWSAQIHQAPTAAGK